MRASSAGPGRPPLRTTAVVRAAVDLAPTFVSEDERAFLHDGCANLRDGPVGLSDRGCLLVVAGGAECGLDAADEVIDALGELGAGLGHVGAQLADDQADPAGGDPGDPFAGLGVGGAVVVGTQEG